MLSSFVGAKISALLLAIVPDVKGWHLLKPKSYKVRLLDFDAKGMDKYYPGELEGNEQRWKDIDGQSIQFVIDHQPRARYLYWQYCTSMLRLA